MQASSDNRKCLENVRNDLQRVVESLIELGVVTHDYPGDEPHSSEMLKRKLSEFINDARQVATRADEVGHISIPLDILTYLDHGRNPDIYSREFVELITKQNQNVAGNIAMLQKFQEILSQDLIAQFPDMKEHVENLLPSK